MKFRLSKTVGEEREIIDFMPTMIGWGSWDNPEQLIECEYILDKDGNKKVNENGYVLVEISKFVQPTYTDGNGNPHTITLIVGAKREVNPILIEGE
jgi:hypothetical protein